MRAPGGYPDRIRDWLNGEAQRHGWTRADLLPQDLHDLWVRGDEVIVVSYKRSLPVGTALVERPEVREQIIGKRTADQVFTKFGC